jgi:hypothetical protein
VFLIGLSSFCVLCQYCLCLWIPGIPVIGAISIYLIFFPGIPVIGTVSIYLIFSLAFLLSELSVIIQDFPQRFCYQSYQYLSDIFPGVPVIGAIEENLE